MALSGTGLIEIRKVSATGTPASVTTTATAQEIADLAGDSGVPVPVTSGGTGAANIGNLYFANKMANAIAGVQKIPNIKTA